MHTDKTAREFVTSAIEASGAAKADEYNLDALMDALYEIAGSWDMTSVETELFWETIKEHSEHTLTDADRETAKYVDDCSTDVLEAIRKAMVERLTRHVGEGASSLTNELMLHCVVDQVTIGIADAAQFQPQGN